MPTRSNCNRYVESSLNAVDAMPKGGTLTVGAAVNAANHMTLTVADTGIGIEADVLRRSFSLFYLQKRRGLGLGLPICERIVKAHAVKLRSRAGPAKARLSRSVSHVRRQPRRNCRSIRSSSERG